ncbi:hypothetical protein [Vibrio mangrovi]|nr:hypothetical protein [Vibrio mangrovi]MDW6003756.1 hypothetical protein [Vibrio mangrovi]
MAIEQISSRVIKKLRQNGCEVVMATKTPRRVMINIEQPTTEMMYRAMEIRQQQHGTRSTIYTLPIDGCMVHWKHPYAS